MARHKIKSEKEDPITVIIAAAGAGRRMRSYGPKPLLTIKGKTILSRQLEEIRAQFPKSNIVLVCGFEADKVMDQVQDDIITLENESYQDTNITRSVSIALRALDSKRALILCGDLVFSKGALGILDYDVSSIIVSRDDRQSSEVGCIVNKSGDLVNMMYDLDLKWGQIIYLQDSILDKFKKLVFDRSNKKLFLFEIINRLIDKGCKIKCVEDDSIEIVDVDVSKDIIIAENIV
tara:strand:- start:2492 stop:3193 length:702 start_codon:yes stop_codon:yes gene_type:complete